MIFKRLRGSSAQPQRIQVDMSRPPSRRWRELKRGRYRRQLGAICTAYVDEIADFIGDPAQLMGVLEPLVDKRWRAELKAIAELSGQSYQTMVIANLYYDAMKLAFGPDVGCTAVAMATPSGPVHARNLDWWTTNGMLARFTTTVDFVGHPNGPFSIVTWPGFIGALSGMASGRFALTLNAVSSGEGFAAGTPVALLLREILEDCKTYTEAVEHLMSKTLCCDCLVMVTGTSNAEMVVIERTPTRAEQRGPVDGVVAATNNYRVIKAQENLYAETALTETSCRRYDRAVELARTARFLTPARSLQILRDSDVQMGLTVQQMAMQASTGQLSVHVAERG